MTQPLMPLAQHVSRLLMTTNTQIVFAESCTAGLVCAILARVPGVSRILCGSAVVYQLATKSEWLGIDPALLENPGPVSDDVARAMATGVLQRTPQANFSAAITGHLGPDAPDGQDGLVFVGIARRESTDISVRTFRHELPDRMTDSTLPEPESLREWRQWKAAELVLNHVRDELE